ncbi:hypothetical protein AMJ86_03645 [bacterium SM23_57]|nr:MAG: hypothetical protein AMJ86_03645 [bacterium SM23_57]
MDWLSVDYCAEIRDYVIDYIARERRRVQQEVQSGPEKIVARVRENGTRMQKLIDALSARINVVG